MSEKRTVFQIEFDEEVARQAAETMSTAEPVSDEELSAWAEKRADDAGRLARELIQYRRISAIKTAEPVSATALELQKVADEARRYAGFYSEATDGRNTFIIFAEWVERRLSALSHVQGLALHGPYGWLNGHRALNEESWCLESDPLGNSEEYFAIPLYSLIDPFTEIGKDFSHVQAPSFECAARSGSVGANDTQDCDHPYCGCDPTVQAHTAVVEDEPYVCPENNCACPGPHFPTPHVDETMVVRECIDIVERASSLSVAHSNLTALLYSRPIIEGASHD